MALDAAIRTELAEAMRRQDTPVVAALRSALAALANAEARPVDEGDRTAVGSEHVAGTTRGVGSGEGARIIQTLEQQRTIVSSEAADLAVHAEQLRARGRDDEADGVLRGRRVLLGVLDAGAAGGGADQSGQDPAGRE